MKILLLALAILLSGCQTLIVDREFPKVNIEMMVPCKDNLVLIPENAKASEVLDVIAQNYTLYHECRIKYNEWIRWYVDQKKNFEEVK